MQMVLSAEAETINLPSGENEADMTWLVWPLKTLRIAGQRSPRPVVTESVWEKRGRKCFATFDLFGENGSADKYIWGALSEMGIWKQTTNRRASLANADNSLSEVWVDNDQMW